MAATTSIYRMESSQRAIALVLLAFGLFFLVLIWGGALTETREATISELGFSFAFTFAAALFMFRAFRNSVRITDTAVEVHGLVSTRILPRDKVKGRRRYLDKGDEHSPSVWHLVLEPNDDRYPKLDIEELYRFDELFYAWFNALPDLDELDKTRSKDSNFGLV